MECRSSRIRRGRDSSYDCSSGKEPFNYFHEPAPGPKDMETAVEGNVYHPLVVDNHSEDIDIELSETEAGRRISVLMNDGSTSEKKRENQSSLNTPPTSMASTDTR